MSICARLYFLAKSVGSSCHLYVRCNFAHKSARRARGQKEGKIVCTHISTHHVLVHLFFALAFFGLARNCLFVRASVDNLCPTLQSRGHRRKNRRRSFPSRHLMLLLIYALTHARPRNLRSRRCVCKLKRAMSGVNVIVCVKLTTAATRQREETQNGNSDYARA